jgi:hypothetical protein
LEKRAQFENKTKTLLPGPGENRFGQLRVKAAFGPAKSRRCAALTRSTQAETVRWSFRE